MKAYPFDCDQDTRTRIITELQSQYSRFAAGDFERDRAGNYPPTGEGKSVSPLNWVYSATHLILSPRESREQSDRTLGRKMILRAIRQARYLNPGHSSHGIWYWSLNDSETSEAPRDRNTPGFYSCGMLRAWAADHQKFSDWPDEDMAEFKEAVRTSFESGEKHWVRLGYTNPQCLDLFLGFAAADLLEDDSIREQTRRRLATFVRFASVCDSFEEWLSPTYAGVNLTGLVPLRWYVRGTEDENAVSDLLDYEWKIIAAGSHAPTREICQPHSRAYGDLAIEHSASLYAWLHLAAPDIYTYTPDNLPENMPWPETAPASFYDGLAASGLYYPLAIPAEQLSDLRSMYAEPVEKRFSIEWVGRHGWLRGDHIQPDDINRPAAEARSRIGSYYKTKDFCLGTVNESFSWIQRRPCGAYWNDNRGAATGIRLQVRFEMEAEEMPFFVFSLLEYAGLQSRNTVLGALLTSTIKPATGAEDLVSALDAAGLFEEQQPANPAAWLLGTHWREGIIAEDLEQRIKTIWFGITPLGRGKWHALDDAGLQWAFAESGTQAVIELKTPGRIEERAHLTRTDKPVQCLTIGSLSEVSWNMLELPEILWPFALQIVAEEQKASTAFDVTGTAYDFEMKNTSMKMTRTATPSWDMLEQPTWRGWVNGREIQPWKEIE